MEIRDLLKLPQIRIRDAESKIHHHQHSKQRMPHTQASNSNIRNSLDVHSPYYYYDRINRLTCICKGPKCECCSQKHSNSKENKFTYLPRKKTLHHLQANTEPCETQKFKIADFKRFNQNSNTRVAPAKKQTPKIIDDLRPFEDENKKVGVIQLEQYVRRQFEKLKLEQRERFQKLTTIKCDQVVELDLISFLTHKMEKGCLQISGNQIEKLYIQDVLFSQEFTDVMLSKRIPNNQEEEPLVQERRFRAQKVRRKSLCKKSTVKKIPEIQQIKISKKGIKSHKQNNEVSQFVQYLESQGKNEALEELLIEKFSHLDLREYQQSLNKMMKSVKIIQNGQEKEKEKDTLRKVKTFFSKLEERLREKNETNNLNIEEIKKQREVRMRESRWREQEGVKENSKNKLERNKSHANIKTRKSSEIEKKGQLKQTKRVQRSEKRVQIQQSFTQKQINKSLELRYIERRGYESKIEILHNLMSSMSSMSEIKKSKHEESGWSNDSLTEDENDNLLSEGLEWKKGSMFNTSTKRLVDLSEEKKSEKLIIFGGQTNKAGKKSSILMRISSNQNDTESGGSNQNFQSQFDVSKACMGSSETPQIHSNSFTKAREDSRRVSKQAVRFMSSFSGENSFAKIREKQQSKFRTDKTQIIELGNKKLKRFHLEYLAIKNTETIFSKKKKITKIRQVLKEKQIDFIPELEQYLQLYEDQCIASMRMDKLTKTESDPNICKKSLKELLSLEDLQSELKFMDLNGKFLFGEADCEDIKFEYCKNREHCSEDIEFDKNETRNKKMNAQFVKSFIEIYRPENKGLKQKEEDLLVQKDVPQSGMMTIVVSPQEKMTQKKKEQKKVEKFEDLTKKIKLFIKGRREQNRSFDDLKRIILTQFSTSAASERSGISKDLSFI